MKTNHTKREGEIMSRLNKPATEFEYKGVTHKITGKRYSSTEDTTLNKLQKLHRKGEINLYAPIKGFREQWKTIYNKQGQYVSAYPIIGTKEPLDLPPIAVQWQQAYRKKLKMEKRDE
jgi:uncharacterized protein YbgA (DUF1722 family)